VATLLIPKGNVCVHRLSWITALGGTDPQIDRIGRCVLAEVPDIALASVSARRGRENATAALLENLISAPPPGPGAAAGAGDVTAFWAGPQQWMVTAPLDSHEVLVDQLMAEFTGKASVTEQTGAWVQFDLSGEAVLDVLERLCALPVRNMVPDMANRTRIEHLGCFVICKAGCFSILGPRSSAASLHHTLVSAMASVG
jgi:sarcosine oxidase subunit gamma